MATIVIQGVTYDVALQPCEIADALRVVRTMRAMGQQVLETEFRSPVSQRRIRLKDVSLSELNDEIAYYDSACNVKNGRGRNRFAKSMRYC